MAKVETLANLLKEIRACRYCEEHLPLGPNPILKVHEESRILIVGQAPGTKVHKTSIPWNDPSGVRLRDWLQMEPDFFFVFNRELQKIILFVVGVVSSLCMGRQPIQ